MKAYSHLSAEERIRIDELRNRDGLGVRQIALRIGRDKATVSRELKRGLWFASNENDSYRPYRPKRLKTGPWTCRPFYSAMTAQRKAEQRAREPRKPRRMAVFCQVGVGRFGVSFSPCERRVSGRFGVGRSCWLLVIALVIA